MFCVLDLQPVQSIETVDFEPADDVIIDDETAHSFDLPTYQEALLMEIINPPPFEPNSTTDPPPYEKISVTE